jgi:hypothetical protein
MMLFGLILCIALVGLVNAQIPCDDAYGANCPEAAGWEVGDCLKNVDQNVLSTDCKSYIAVHDACKGDIEQHCTGKEYTGDALGKNSHCILHAFVFT